LKDLDSALKFNITVENKKKFEDVENYDEVDISKSELTSDQTSRHSSTTTIER